MPLNFQIIIRVKINHDWLKSSAWVRMDKIEKLKVES